MLQLTVTLFAHSQVNGTLLVQRLISWQIPTLLISIQESGINTAMS